MLAARRAPTRERLTPRKDQANPPKPKPAPRRRYLSSLHPGTTGALLAELSAAGVPCSGDPEAAAAALADPEVLCRLPFMGAVLNEAMRLYPAGVSAAPRLTERPIVVAGVRVPAGVTVLPCLYVLLNYSGNWEEPEKFEPERWLPGGAGDGASADTGGGARGAFIPFSLGPKRCVGQHLALQQCKAALALLLSCFEVRNAPRMGAPEEVEARTYASLELRVEGGIWVQLRRRRPAAAAAPC